MSKASPKVTWSVAFMLTTGALAATQWYFVPQLRWVWGWVIAATLVAAIAFFWDKWRAARHPDEPSKRVPEIALIFTCLIGGTVGGIAMMIIRHHKTRDKKFLLMLAAVMILQSAIGGFLLAQAWYGGAGT